MTVNPQDAALGLYNKFTVTRTDGRHKAGEKHHGCRYFVLDVNHDAHAVPALLAYAASCKAAFPALAEDLEYLAGRLASDRALHGDVEDPQSNFRVGTAWQHVPPATEEA